MKTPLLSTLLALMIGVAFQAHAVEYTFTSSLDRFTVDLNKGTATFQGGEVRPAAFAQVAPLFSARFEDPCEGGLGKPDLTITRKRESGEDKRVVYIKKKLVSDGTNCATITGEGLFEMPLHRNWFTGDSTVTIALNNSFAVLKDNKTLASFTKKGGKWQSDNATLYVDWTFFNNFTGAMKDIPIEYRVHPEALDGEKYSQFELVQGDRKFIFTKFRDKNWAIQFPTSPWLAVTSRFGFIDEMTEKTWQSAAAGPLALISNPAAKPAERLKALKDLGSSWSGDALAAFSIVLLAEKENYEAQKEIVNMLRSRPTDESFKLLVQAVQKTEDFAYLTHLTKALRVRNPKGPVITDEDDDTAVEKKKQDWATWSKGLK